MKFYLLVFDPHVGDYVYYGEFDNMNRIHEIVVDLMKYLVIEGRIIKDHQ